MRHFIILLIISIYTFISWKLNQDKENRHRHWVMIFPLLLFISGYLLINLYLYYSSKEIEILNTLLNYLLEQKFTIFILFLIQTLVFLLFKFLFLRFLGVKTDIIPYHYTKSNTQTTFRQHKYEVFRDGFLLITIIGSVVILIVYFIKLNNFLLEGVSLITLIAVESYWYLNGLTKQPQLESEEDPDENNDSYKNVEAFNQYFKKLSKKERVYKILRKDKLINLKNNKLK